MVVWVKLGQTMELSYSKTSLMCPGMSCASASEARFDDWEGLVRATSRAFAWAKRMDASMLSPHTTDGPAASAAAHLTGRRDEKVIWGHDAHPRNLVMISLAALVLIS